MSTQKDYKVEPETISKPSCRRRLTEYLRMSNFFRNLVILACIVVVVQQISICVQKMMNRPITTYTHFDFNKTLLYPSITFCREPPYKFKKMIEYGLYGHPRFTSTWAGFNFSRTTLDQLWEDITYDSQDYFVTYGLDQNADNVVLSSTMSFVMGRCMTLSPKDVVTSTSAYSVTLQHYAEDIDTSISINPPGYHVFIHYAREPYTEVNVSGGGLVDYLYVYYGEILDIKLTVDEYVKLNYDDMICTDRQNYSANLCTTKCVSDAVGDEIGCSGPWMMSNLPRCAVASQMRNLITTYLNTYQSHNCKSCPRLCRSYLYNGFVSSRRSGSEWDNISRQWYKTNGAAALQTQLFIHFNSMMVSVYEERYNYDWSLFLSDLGGSIGFLLGLSVIGLLKIFGSAWSYIMRPCIKSSKVMDSSSVTGSTITTNIQDLKPDECIQKYKDWETQNKIYSIT